MSMIQTGSFPRLLIGDQLKMFGMEYAQLAPIHEKVYMKTSSDSYMETALQLDSFARAEVKQEGAAVTVSGISQGYGRMTLHKTYQKACSISMEAEQDGKLMKVADKIPALFARSLVYAKETVAAALFNNATSSSAPYVGADGVALLSASHPAKQGGTLSNLSSSDLTELALENACIAMDRWIDNAGELMSAKPKALLLPPEQKFAITRLVDSQLRSGTAENDLNAFTKLGVFPSVMTWSYITDTNSWFILTDQEGLVQYERMAPTNSYHLDENTKDHVYDILARFSFDHYDPRAVYGSLGSS